MSGAQKIAISAAIGGTAEAMGGGKFANGAVTGAYVMALNHMEHELKEKKADKISDECSNYIPKEIWAKFTKEGAKYISHEDMSKMLWEAFDPGSELTAWLVGIGGLGTSFGSFITSGIVATTWTSVGLILTFESTVFTVEMIRIGEQQKSVLQNYWGGNFSSPTEQAGAFITHNHFGYYGGGIGIKTFYSAHTGTTLGSILIEYKVH
jgi:hypothetical protein